MRQTYLLAVLLVVALLGLSAGAAAQEVGSPDAAMTEIETVVAPMLADPVEVASQPAVQPPTEAVEAPAAVDETPDTAMPEIDVDQMADMVKTPGGLVVLVGLICWILLELMKGFWPGFANASAAFKWSISVTLGIGIGTLFALFASVTYPWWVGTIAGAVGSGGVSGTRAFGKWVRGKPQKAIRKLTHGIGALMVVLVLVGGFSGCSGTQIIGGQAGIWANGAMMMTDCLIKCGMPTLTDNIIPGYGQVSVDLTNMKQDGIACLTNCALQVGLPTIITSIAGAFNGVKDLNDEPPATRTVLIVTQLE